MYRYCINDKLVTTSKPLEGYTRLTLTDKEASECIGFVNNIPIFKKVNKDLLKEKILEFGYSEIEKGIEFKGNTYQVDEQSIIRMNLFKDYATSWRTKDNKNIPMSSSDMKQLFIDSISYSKTIFDISRKLIDQLYGLDESELKSYNIQERWKNGISP